MRANAGVLSAAAPPVALGRQWSLNLERRFGGVQRRFFSLNEGRGARGTRGARGREGSRTSL